MANVFGTLAPSTLVLVQEILATLLVKFPILTQITKDYSDKGAFWNQQITSRVVVPTVAIEHVPLTGYQAQDRTTVDVPLTINKQAEHTFTVTDREQSQTPRNLREELRKTAVHALGTKIVNDLFATVAAASYPLAYPQASANFDAADLRRIKTMCNKAFMPDMGDRFAVLNSDFAEGLGLDNVIVANPNGSNQQVIKGGDLGTIHGFQTSEFASLTGPVGEQLGGIAGNPEAILMASRVPDVPASPDEIPGVIANVTDPNTGLTIQYRRWYQMNPAQAYEVLTLMYGFNVGLSETGISKRLVRIVGV